MPDRLLHPTDRSIDLNTVQPGDRLQSQLGSVVVRRKAQTPIGWIFRVELQNGDMVDLTESQIVPGKPVLGAWEPVGALAPQKGAEGPSGGAQRALSMAIASIRSASRTSTPRVAAIQPEYAQQKREKLLDNISKQKWWKQTYDPRPPMKGDIITLGGEVPAIPTSPEVGRMLTEAVEPARLGIIALQPGSPLRVMDDRGHAYREVMPAGDQVYMRAYRAYDGSLDEADAYENVTVPNRGFALQEVNTRGRDLQPLKVIKRAKPVEGPAGVNLLADLLEGLPPEAATMYDWIVREAKAGRLDLSSRYDRADLERAIPFVEWQRVYGNKDFQLTGALDLRNEHTDLRSLRRWADSLGNIGLDPETNEIKWPEGGSKPIWTDSKGNQVLPVTEPQEFQHHGDILNQCFQSEEYLDKYMDMVKDNSAIYMIRSKMGHPLATAVIGFRGKDEEHPYGTEWVPLETRSGGHRGQQPLNQDPNAPGAATLDAWFKAVEKAGIEVDRTQENQGTPFDHLEFRPLPDTENYEHVQPPVNALSFSHISDLADLRKLLAPDEFDSDETYRIDEDLGILYYTGPPFVEDGTLDEVLYLIEEWVEGRIEGHSTAQSMSAPEITDMLGGLGRVWVMEGPRIPWSDMLASVEQVLQDRPPVGPNPDVSLWQQLLPGDDPYRYGPHSLREQYGESVSVHEDALPDDVRALFAGMRAMVQPMATRGVGQYDRSLHAFNSPVITRMDAAIGRWARPAIDEVFSGPPPDPNQMSLDESGWEPTMTDDDITQYFASWQPVGLTAHERVERSFIYRVSARIHAKDLSEAAAEARQAAEKKLDKWAIFKAGQDGGDVDTLQVSIRTAFDQIPDEAYRMFTWLATNVPKGRVVITGPASAERIGTTLGKAGRMWYDMRRANKPTPDLYSMGFDEISKWLKEQEWKKLEEEGMEWTDSEVVYRLPDGYTIQKVGLDDLGMEGKLMGHCVGNDNFRRDVKQENITVFSLRDAKNLPHVTLHIDNAKLPDYSILDIKGKQNRVPIPKYRDMLDLWYEALEYREGIEVTDEESEEARQEHLENLMDNPEYETIDTITLDDLYDLQRVGGLFMGNPFEFQFGDGEFYPEYADRPDRYVHYRAYGVSGNPAVALEDAVSAALQGQLDPEDALEVARGAFFASVMLETPPLYAQAQEWATKGVNDPSQWDEPGLRVLLQHLRQLENLDLKQLLRYGWEDYDSGSDSRELVDAVKEIPTDMLMSPDTRWTPQPGEGQISMEEEEGWTAVASKWTPVSQWTAAHMYDNSPSGSETERTYRGQTFRIGDRVRYRDRYPSAPPSPTEFEVIGFPPTQTMVRVDRLKDGKRTGEVHSINMGTVMPVEHEDKWPDTLPLSREWNNMPDTPEQMERMVTHANGQKVDDDIMRVIRQTLKHGGGTFDPDTLESVERDDGQYQVSLNRSLVERRASPTTSRGQLADMLREYLEEFKDLLAKPDYYFGTWKDETTGEIVIDVSTTVDSLEQALALGRQWRQQAILDWGALKRKEWDKMFIDPNTQVPLSSDVE